MTNKAEQHEHNQGTHPSFNREALQPGVILTTTINNESYRCRVTGIDGENVQMSVLDNRTINDHTDVTFTMEELFHENTTWGLLQRQAA